MAYYVYVLASRRDGTLYVGVTGDLVRRVYEHRNGLVAGFTKKYGVKRLVYFEEYPEPRTAIQREKKYQTLVSRLEDKIDRARESRLARFIWWDHDVTLGERI